MNDQFHPVEQDLAKPSTTTRTLSRGLLVLSEILSAETSPTLTELATRTGLAKATVSRLLATLVESGFAAQQPDSQQFFVGPAIARWLRTSPMEALLAEQAAPVLEDLRDRSTESVVVCVPAWPDRVCILCSLSESPVRAQKSIGETGPLTRGCTGRAFLAFAQRTFVDAAIQARPLVKNTASSIVDLDEFHTRLAEERELGYTMSIEGAFPDMNGIAVPIFGSSSSMPIAVINISGPSTRWTEEAMTAFAPVLQTKAAELSNHFVSAGAK